MNKDTKKQHGCLTRTSPRQVTAIYLTLHKKEVLNKVSDSVARVDIAQIAGQISEEEESADRSGLFENVKKVHEINRAVRTGACPCQRARRHSHSAHRLTARFLRWTASRSSAAMQR